MAGRTGYGYTQRVGQGGGSAVEPAHAGVNDADEIFRMYVAAAVMTELTGQPYVVDHIVPLASPLVSGLHCPANLEVVRKPENQAKSNLFWPQMGCVSWENWVQLRDFHPDLQEDPFQRAEDDEKPAPEPAPVRRRRVDA